MTISIPDAIQLSKLHDLPSSQDSSTPLCNSSNAAQRTQRVAAVLQVAALAAQAGSRVIERYYCQGIHVRSKSADESYNLVSDADVESEKAIVEVIRSFFPDHEIIGEEQAMGSIHAEHLWIIDPLDGTNNFAHRIPQFAVSIGYYFQGAAQCGVVVNPANNSWYWAERGRGAFHDGHSIFVGRESSLDQSMVGVGFYYDRGAMMEATLATIADFFRQKIHGIRRFGSAALDLCYVAEGQFAVFFEYQLSPWDFAAGRLILEEAGGMITTCQGHPLPLASCSVLASNGRLHDQALSLVSPRHP